MCSVADKSLYNYRPMKKEKGSYLDKRGVFKDLVGVTNELELLHYSDRGIQIQNDSCGRNTEVHLSKENGFIHK